jgi:enamine deaminase RidA (YjgF/YER057c/UK114 family)
VNQTIDMTPTSDVEDRLRALGFELPTDVAPAANYELSVQSKGLLFVSGQLPRVGNSVAVTGSVGIDVSLEEARHGARLCVLRSLAVVKQGLGSLDLVERIVRLVVYVQSGAGFVQQSDVADAASDLLYAVFGQRGGHARTAVGVFQLPRNASVELEMTVAVDEG